MNSRTKFLLGSVYPASLAVLLLSCFIPLPTRAQELRAEQAKPCAVMVVGFVGGMRSPDDVTQGVVQIGQRLNKLRQPNLQITVARHWHWRRVYQELYQHIDRNHDQKLSDEERSLAPKIVIYGHSLGGWAVLKLSRKLAKAEIPVELTVQIDSVGAGDEVIPANVKAAVNYYQRSLPVLRGEKKVRAADEKKTTIEGNFLIRDVGHDALARETEISDFITDKVRRLCGYSELPFNPQYSQIRLTTILPFNGQLSIINSHVCYSP